MSYDLGKKIGMGAFALSTLAMLFQHVSALFIYRFSESVVIGFYNVLAVLHFGLIIIAAGGFAMMWLMGGNLFDILIAGLMAVGIIARIFIPQAGHGVEALSIASLVVQAESALYLLVWAYKYYRKDLITAVLLVGAFIVSIFANPLTNFLTVGVGLGRSFCIFLISIPLEIILGGIKIYAMMNESEKKK